MSSIDLRQYYLETDSTLTTYEEQGKEIIFDKNALPPAPVVVSTAEIYITSAYHIYEDLYRVRSIWIQCRQETCRYLGLLILSNILNPTLSEVTLTLRHKYSTFKRLIIRPYRSHTAPNGYLERGVSFEYEHSVVERYPWISLHPRINIEDLPCFFLPIGDERKSSDDTHHEHDTIFGFGSDRGSLLLAQFLLDIGLGKESNPIYDLEGEAGNRGCGPLSAEAKFILPGSDAWNESLWHS
jgi:hypothetical protein